MVVSMLVMSIVLGMVFTAMINMQNSANRRMQQASQVLDAQQGIAQLERQIRSGNVLYNPAGEPIPLSMRVYTQSNGESKCVQWRIVDSTNQLQMRSGHPTYHTVSEWRTIAEGVINSVDPTDPASTLDSPFVLRYIAPNDTGRMVDIRLFVRHGTSGPSTEVRTSVTGRNTQYGYDPNVCDFLSTV